VRPAIMIFTMIGSCHRINRVRDISMIGFDDGARDVEEIEFRC